MAEPSAVSLPSTKERFGTTFLLAADSDNTIALTSEPAPNGMNVELAYQEAIGKVLGHVALEEYNRTNGLNNRAPGEVVQQLWPNFDPGASAQTAADLVDAKLELLLPQIGRRLTDGELWPRPVEGFVAAWHRFDEMLTVGMAVTRAVVSSGHDAFIERFFEVQGLNSPDIVVTDDTLRREVSFYDYAQYVKPSPRLMELVHSKWLRWHGLEFSDLSAGDVDAMRKRTLYIGDDRKKDDKLAEAANVRFIRIVSDGSWLVASGMLLNMIRWAREDAESQ